MPQKTMQKVNGKQKSKTNLTPEKLSKKINDFRLLFKNAYKENIIQTNDMVKKCKAKLAKAKEKQKTLQQQTLSTNAKVKPSKSAKTSQKFNKIKISKISPEFQAINNKIQALHHELNQLREDLKWQKLNLAKHVAEEQLLNQFSKNWDDNTQLIKKEQKVKSPKTSITSLVQPPSVDHFPLFHISHPPTPTDGPDQAQSEADLVSATISSININDLQSKLISPFHNYLMDDEGVDSAE